jgi:hypothetical protein
MIPQLARAQAAAPAGRVVRLRSGVQRLRFGRLDYRMSYVLEQDPAVLGRPASFLDVVLWRTAPGSAGTATQSNQYSFQPDEPFTFTWAHATLQSASVDSGSAIEPSALTASFAATSPAVDTICTSDTGTKVHLRRAVGDLTYSAFAIDTGALPYFGTLTSGPLRASLEVDDGCAAGGGPPPNQCPGHQELSFFKGNQLWSFASDYRRAVRSVGHLDFGSFDTSPTRIRFMQSPAPAAAFPRARWSAKGATAHLTAAGNPFMRGSATFGSVRAPGVSGLQTCVSAGRRHRFRELRYAGVVRPDSSPLTAVYDTGPDVLRAGTAELLVRTYVS